ncbi:MAG: 16S rRNA pseudouridine(516) synthase RsuA [Candidatus Thiodiazotropha sp.]|jgi:16S rRNA pseudouridine516 synthase
MRLDRYLCQTTDLTRSQARRVIRGGRVSVGGAPVTHPASQVDIQAEVTLDESLLTPPLPRYFMLNKPLGVVCATRDPSQRTVLDLFDLPKRSTLHIAGRLDIDSSGLVLVTDDGQWSHRITAPSNHCPKTYYVTLAEPLTVEQASSLAVGLLLKGESKVTKPATVEKVSEHELRLTITEGRYHQVKRMFAALGNHVVALHRLSIGGLALDSSLLPGAYRSLTTEEITLF